MDILNNIPNRVFVDVPDAAFNKVVKHYAFFIGKPVFTHKDLKKAFANYINFGSRWN